MKKQILSLMLSAVIFTTNPLFAMDRAPEIQEARIIPHACPTCTQMVKFEVSNDAEDEGKGDFRALLDENVVSIISELPREAVYSASFASKAMYNLCQHPFVWNSLANKEKENFIFPSIPCVKNCFQTASLNYFNLFTDKTPEVQVPISWLLSRKDKGLTHSDRFFSSRDFLSTAYNLFYLSCFEKGKDFFILFSPREKDLSILKSVDDKDLITFSWVEEGNCPWDINLFRSKGSIFEKDTEIDIENCFCIQNSSHFFSRGSN